MRRTLTAALVAISLLLGAQFASAQTLEEMISLANEGIPSYQCMLGYKYLDGDGVEKNIPEAVKWFKLAAGNGDVYAAYTLGKTFHDGDGMPQDYTEAMKWFRVAAELGDANSQYRVAEMYEHGTGIEKDYVAAYAWLSLAIGNGANKRGIRDTLERDMSASQIEEAKALSESIEASFD
jgi:TPR repeat protein